MCVTKRNSPLQPTFDITLHLHVHDFTSSQINTNILVQTVPCLKYFRYTQCFGNWLGCHINLISSDDTKKFLIILF
jgi:hypothetical protein